MERYNSLLFSSESSFLEWSSQYREWNLSLTSSRFFWMCTLQMSFSSRWTPRYFTCAEIGSSTSLRVVTEWVETESKVYPYGLRVVSFHFPTLSPVVEVVSRRLKVCWGNSVIFVSGEDCVLEFGYFRGRGWRYHFHPLWWFISSVVRSPEIWAFWLISCSMSCSKRCWLLLSCGRGASFLTTEFFFRKLHLQTIYVGGSR